MNDAELPRGGHLGRIALFVPALVGGGITTVMIALAKGLADRGFSVDLLVCNQSGERTEDVPGNIRLVDLEVRKLVTTVPALVGYLRKARPDLLIAASWYAVLPALVSKRFLRRGTRTWVRQDNVYSMQVAYAQFRNRVVLKLIGRLLPAADRVIAVSAGVARNLERNVPRISGSLTVIANPVVDRRLAEKATMAVDHPWLNDPDVPVILSAGRLVHAKDFATLIRAFARLSDSVRARLIILGDGPEEDTLKALAQTLGVAESVGLPGFVANPYAWMSKAQVFALSSVYEGLPTVLIEALACGTPVVSTRCPHGPDEVLEDGRWGPLVPVGDADALARAIEATLKDPIASDLLVSRAQAFSVSRAADRHIELLMDDTDCGAAP